MIGETRLEMIFCRTASSLFMIGTFSIRTARLEIAHRAEEEVRFKAGSWSDGLTLFVCHGASDPIRCSRREAHSNLRLNGGRESASQAFVAKASVRGGVCFSVLDFVEYRSQSSRTPWWKISRQCRASWIACSLAAWVLKRAGSAWTTMISARMEYAASFSPSFVALTTTLTCEPVDACQADENRNLGGGFQRRPCWKIVRYKARKDLGKSGC